MDTQKTELVFVIDKSGSMSGLESDTVGGFNSMVRKQQQVPGTALTTTVLFDSEVNVLHDRLDIKSIGALGEQDYLPGGTTALLDAVGLAIDKIVNVQRHTAESMQAGHVVFVIITDGLENASKRYTHEQIKQMIAPQKEEYGWEFIFLGANIDAAGAAMKVGIDRSRAANFHADPVGVQLNYEVIGRAVGNIRVGKHISDDWKDAIDEDYKKRSGKR